MAYPSIQQYQEVLQHPATAFSDTALARGKIRSSGLGTPIVVSGGFALTYAVEASGTKYAVRCFHREAKGLERRYGAISTKLKALGAGGLLCGLLLAQATRTGAIHPPPEATALGGIRTHLARPQPTFQPSNLTWACLPPHENRKLKKRERYTALAERALANIDGWVATAPLARIESR